jgi:hypothetical protein
MACLPAAYEVSCRIRTGSPRKLLAFIHPGRWQAVVLVPPLLGAEDLAGKPPAMWRRRECPPAPEGSQPLRAAEDGGLRSSTRRRGPCRRARRPSTWTRAVATWTRAVPTWTRAVPTCTPAAATWTRAVANLDAGCGHLDAGRGHLDAACGHTDACCGHLDAGRGHLDAGRGRVDAAYGHQDTGRGHLDAGCGQHDTGRGHLDAGCGHQTRAVPTCAQAPTTCTQAVNNVADGQSCSSIREFTGNVGSGCSLGGRTGLSVLHGALPADAWSSVPMACTEAAA